MIRCLSSRRLLRSLTLDAAQGQGTWVRPHLMADFPQVRDASHRQVSLLSSRTFRTFRLQPPLTFPTAVLGFVLALGLHRMGPTGCPVPHSLSTSSLGLRHSLAGSPRSQAESSSLALRTDRSPPVAPHPASRRRSYLRLREAKPPLDGDLHPAGSYTVTGALVLTLRVRKVCRHES